MAYAPKDRPFYDADSHMMLQCFSHLPCRLTSQAKCYL